VKGATTLAGSLVRAFGRPYASPNQLSHLFPRPEDLLEQDLTSIGLTRSRAATISGLARAVVDRKISFEGVVAPEDFRSRICEIPGIGAWTAQYVAMRALGEPDAFPSGDLGLLRSLGLTKPADLERRAEAWRPWRAYATMYLWSFPSQAINTPQPGAKGAVARSGAANQTRVSLEL
jgi:AraC family transcriptional regulator, regulatory protein of adaptative response / DNA-3-methyladenine glycosylase II